MANNTITIPGAVDLHVHFREPGDNKAETIKSGSKAALLGGFGLVCDMPNNPGNPTWTKERLQQKQAIINKSSYIPMATYAGAQPESNNLAELEEMAKSSIGLKLYGSPNVSNYEPYQLEDFRPIVEKWHSVAPDKPIMFHLGSSDLGEVISLIAEEFTHQLHVCHVSNPREVELVSAAKQKDLKVTCGVCPHHLFKTSHHSRTEGWFARMLPGLPSQIDAEELWQMFVKGEIDILETDHAPHLAEKKWSAETDNPGGTPGPRNTTCFGLPGIEFALPLLFYQMGRKQITIDRIIESVSAVPARIIGVKLSPKTQATWRLDEYRIGDDYPKGLSGSGWTPYMNNLAVGKLWRSQVGDKVLVDGGKIIGQLPKVSQRGDVI